MKSGESKEEPKPAYWQMVPCVDCDMKFYATPWVPQGKCCGCGRPLQVVAVYLPWVGNNK